MKKSNWSVFLFNGVIAILFGLLMLIESQEGIIRLMRYFGILMIIVGALMALIAYTNNKRRKPYLALMASALVTIGAGAIIAFLPEKSLKIFLVLVGAWAVLAGLYQIIIAVRMKGRVSQHQLFTVNGVVTLVFGILLLINPMATAILVMRIIGILALVSGVLLLYLGVKIRTSSGLE